MARTPASKNEKTGLPERAERRGKREKAPAGTNTCHDSGFITQLVSQSLPRRRASDQPARPAADRIYGPKKP